MAWNPGANRAGAQKTRAVLEVVGHNVRSIKGKRAKDFFEWVVERAPDVIALQETRCAPGDLPTLEGYDVTAEHHKPASGAKCGVALYTKANLGARKLDAAFCEEHDDCRGRYVEVELTGGTRIVSVYVPDGQSNAGKHRYDAFWTCLFERLRALANERAIVVGDFNTVFSTSLDMHGDIRLMRGDGAREVELATRLCENFGWIDSFRHLNSNAKQFTFWPPLRKTEGFPWSGTRIDYQLATKALRAQIAEASIRVPETRAELFSDHATTVHRYGIEVASTLP